MLKKYAVTQNAAIVVTALIAIAVLSVVGIWAIINRLQKPEDERQKVLVALP
ncbi:TPA: hypothetical protein JLQ72_004157 [Escherichia coli]|nr:hypothetical protein [Escherichia coli]HAW2816711.1 hypothetical protein [Escherichia coli]